MTAVHVDALSRKFKNALAVDAISFDVAQGEIFGFLGPTAPERRRR